MAGLGTYLRAAFHARPLGMPIPPNWIALAACGLVGWFIHPGIWVIGAGLELGYLAVLTSNERFRTLVDQTEAQPAPAAIDRRELLITQLDSRDRQAHAQLEAACLAIGATAEADVILREQQAEQLRQLCWLHLRLLAARSAVRTVAATGAKERDDLSRRLRELEAQQPGAASDLAQSLAGQIAIVRTRLEQFATAAGRLAYLDAEIERLRQQADLLRDQALLAASGDDPGLSATIGALSDSLAATNRWMRDQRLTADLAWEEAPALTQGVNRTQLRT
jgi:hypothetical protein